LAKKLKGLPEDVQMAILERAIFNEYPPVANFNGIEAEFGEGSSVVVGQYKFIRTYRQSSWCLNVIDTNNTEVGWQYKGEATFEDVVTYCILTNCSNMRLGDPRIWYEYKRGDK